MSLSALPTALLIPPVNLVPIGLVGLWLARRHARLGKTIAVLSLAGLLVLAMPATGRVLLGGLQADIPRTLPEPPSPADRGRSAVIILSADGHGQSEGGILPSYAVGSLTLERMQAGARLARSLGLPILVTGGPSTEGAPPIARQMETSLREDFGLETRWVEPRADDTWQNAEFSTRLLAADGIRRAYVVSDAWHLRRAMIAFRHFGFEAVPVASRFEGAPSLDPNDLIPRISGWVLSYYAIHEWIGCVYYAIGR